MPSTRFQPMLCHICQVKELALEMIKLKNQAIVTLGIASRAK